uniref:Zgc:194252 n=1 Tax=Amphilophus citrinellus TaxID=61819 RepID=A0A3Q0RYI5_AMPCI
MKTNALRLLILTFFCKVALGINSGHDYYVNIEMTWSEARNYCREHYTDLSSITNQDEDNAMSELSSGSDSGKEGIWIGLYEDANDTWKWSGGENTSFFNWAMQESTSVMKSCVVHKTSGWLTKNCEDVFPFFCFHKALLLVKENKTWEEALEHCRSREMDLVSLVSESDVVQVLEISKTAQTDNVWTSLRYLGDTWLWVDKVIDNQQSGTQNEMPQCPTWSHHCGALSLQVQHLDSWDCADRLNFICYCKGSSVSK